MLGSFQKLLLQRRYLASLYMYIHGLCYDMLSLSSCFLASYRMCWWTVSSTSSNGRRRRRLLILLLSPAFHRDSRESTTFIFSVTIPYAANTISQLLLLLLLLMLFLADLFLLLLLMLLLMMLLMLQKSEESSSDIVNRLFGKGDIHFNDIADVLVLPVLILLLFVIFDYSSAVFFLNCC
jgi:hypothetical protein